MSSEIYELNLYRLSILTFTNNNERNKGLSRTFKGRCIKEETGTGTSIVQRV